MHIPPLNAASILKRYGLRAEKRLGQNFLEDTSALEKITFAADIDPQDTILEIGPGLGSLTRYLASSARKVVAVELDRELIPPLEAVLAPHPNVQLIQGDILKIPISNLIDQPDYLVVANIPYNITSVLLRHLLESDPQPRRIVLTIQREVAERICATPGDLSLLALSVQIYGHPTVTARIPAQAFFPIPKVDSAVLRIDIFPDPLIPQELLSIFFQLIKAGFAQKRKTLRNSLASGLHISPVDSENLLLSAGIDPKRRAETLSIQEWKWVSEIVKGGQTHMPKGGK